MKSAKPKDPLHGITLEMILTRLVDHYGWKRLAKKLPINCFTKEPTMTSSLKLLRRTEWARKKVETLYLRTRFHKVFPDSAPKPRLKKVPPQEES
ncbi:MAG: VF530 family protein [Desulfurivibrionaceae bacterium]|nr:VF530 family protein [Desulfurivibrionaceae bacterium]